MYLAVIVVPITRIINHIRAKLPHTLGAWNRITHKRRLQSRPSGCSDTAKEYINLSLQHYQDGEWEKCVEASIGALNINPSSALAYNNICAAYVQLKDFDRAILACNKALALRPDFPRARGNLNAAIKKKGSN